MNERASFDEVCADVWARRASVCYTMTVWPDDTSEYETTVYVNLATEGDDLGMNLGRRWYAVSSLVVVGDVARLYGRRKTKRGVAVSERFLLEGVRPDLPFETPFPRRLRSV